MGPDPVCNRYLQWDDIKLDIIDVVERYVSFRDNLPKSE